MNVDYFWPMVAQVVLTATVWVRMYVVRIAELREKRIHPQKIATSQTKGLLQNTQAADNFVNLFEVPVLFYAVCLVIGATGIESLLLLVLAWVYVALRALHSFIQVTYNKVMHRFQVYVASTLVVFALWIITAVKLV